VKPGELFEDEADEEREERRIESETHAPGAREAKLLVSRLVGEACRGLPPADAGADKGRSLEPVPMRLGRDLRVVLGQCPRGRTHLCQPCNVYPRKHGHAPRRMVVDARRDRAAYGS